MRVLLTPLLIGWLATSAFAGTESTLPTVPISSVQLQIPVSLDDWLTAITAETQASVRPQGEREDFRDGLRLDYAILRDALTVTVEDDRLALRAESSMWLQVYGDDLVDAACGRPDPIPGTFGGDLRLGWGEQWKLDAQVKQVPSVWATRCKPIPPGINFNRFLNERLERFLVQPLLGHAVESIRGIEQVPAQIAAAWRILQAPMDLHEGELWLQWDPIDLVAAPVRSSGRQLLLDVTIRARPRIVVGSRPQLDELPLPDTRVRLAGEKIHVVLDHEVELAEVEATLAALANGRELHGREASASIEQVTVGSVDDRLWVELAMPGVMEEPLRLEGELVYDPEARTLSVPELSFLRESGEAFFAATDGTLRGEFDAVRQEMTAALVFDLGPVHQQTLRRLGLALNSPWGPQFAMSGGALVYEALGTFVTGSSLGVRLAAQGKATLRWTGDAPGR